MRSVGERTLAEKPRVATRDVGSPFGELAADFEVVARGYDFEYRTCSNEFEIRRSVESGVCYLFPQPAPEALDVIYPPDYGPFQFQSLRGPSRWARDIVQRGKAQVILRLAGRGGKIFDVGAGSGALLRQLRHLGAPAECLSANDVSEHSLDALAEAGFAVIPGPAEAIDTRERFDVICLNQVLEHMAQPIEVVHRLASLLSPGAYLYVETPSTDGLDARAFRRRYWGGYHFPRHFVLFNEATLRRLFSDAGLEAIEVTYLASPAFWIQCFHHALFDRGWFTSARFFTIRNPVLLAAATAMDLITMLMGRPTSNIRIIGRKPR